MTFKNSCIYWLLFFRYKLPDGSLEDDNSVSPHKWHGPMFMLHAFLFMWPLLCWGVLERKTTAVLDRFRKGHVEKAASLFVYVRYLLFIDFDPILKFCKEYFKKKKKSIFFPAKNLKFDPFLNLRKIKKKIQIFVQKYIFNPILNFFNDFFFLNSIFWQKVYILIHIWT